MMGIIDITRNRLPRKMDLRAGIYEGSIPFKIREEGLKRFEQAGDKRVIEQV